MTEDPLQEMERLRREIADLREQLEALRRSQDNSSGRFLEELIRQAPVGAHEYELQPDGSLIFTGGNAAADRILGIDNSAFVGMAIEEAFPPLAGGPIPGACREVVRSGRSYESELVEYRDGRISGAFEVSAFRHAPNGVIMLFRDITERMRAEQALKESEGRLRTVVSNAPIVLFALDADGRFTLSEGRGLETLGLRAGQVVGQSVFELYADYPEVLSAIRRALAGEAFAGTTTVAGVTFETWYEPLRGRSGESTGMLGVAVDNSERRSLQGQLFQAQKIDSIGRLAGGIAHDFNNLLTVIIGFSEMAVSSLQPGSPARSDLQEVIAAGKRASALTTKLLGFARKQPVSPRRVDLSSVVHDAEKMIRRMLSENIEILVTTDRHAAPVLVDPNQVDQVLVNLAVNARDAMPDGGKLFIETSSERVTEAGAARSAELTPGDYSVLSVSDTGIGMSEEARQHLFEPFFTTKAPGKGIGLGLATCHGIVKQNNGHIFVFSEPGRGTTVRVYLPRSSQPEDQGDTEAAGASPVQGNETILVVEDDSAVRSLAVIGLRAYGFAVLEADSGESALAMASRHRGAIALLVSDVIMPGMGGRNLAKQLTRMHPKMAVLLVSGHDPEAIGESAGAEQIAFLQKPFTPARLARAVRETIDRTKKR